MRPEAGMGARLRLLLFREGRVLALLFALLVIGLALTQPNFLSGNNVVNVLRSSAFLIIAASAQMLALVVGGIDLSIGAVIALTSVVSASIMGGLPALGVHATAAIVALGVGSGFGCGLAVGLVNGLCVAVLRVPAFMTTLGTLSIANGIGLLLTNGIPVYGMPDKYVAVLGRAIIGGLPIALYFAAVVVLLLWLAIRFTRFGRYIYATGGNLQAAMVSGIPTVRMLVLAYVLSSLLGSLTGLLLTAEIGSGQATTGEALMLESLAAAVLAGVSLRGGVGRIELVALAAIFLLTLTNAMDLMRVDTRLQLIVLGLVLALAVSAETLNQREPVRV
ncbi:MAG: ABC transporter permease [Alphaproteobacteria bacterium]|nr:ABC transporter permease [Alphaproteobacteria bacterium]